MKKTMRFFGQVMVVSFILLTTVPAISATLAGVSLPDQATVGEKALVLNGLGLRTATMLKVKVYVIGLYLESKSNDAGAIIDSRKNKRLEMHFVHKVTAKELQDGWKEGFEDNYKDVASIKSEIAKFNASMQDMKGGDSIVLDFSGDMVAVMINGAKIDTMEGNAFQQALLSIWLGRKPPNEDLKKGILGN